MPKESVIFYCGRNNLSIRFPVTAERFFNLLSESKRSFLQYPLIRIKEKLNENK